LNVTIQLTPDLSDTSVEKCSLTVVSSASSSRYQTNQRQSEQLELVVTMQKGES